MSVEFRIIKFLCFFLHKALVQAKQNTNVNPKNDNCDAEAKLFIPSHRLKIPRVIVSTAKKSTVPKSETVSINTNDNPATIAGLARGKETK